MDLYISKYPLFKQSVTHPEYAAFGAVLSTTSVTSISFNVGLFCASWPAWAIGFQHCVFNIKWIYCYDSNCIECIRSIFPTVQVHHVNQFDPSVLNGVHIVGVSDQLPDGINLENYHCLQVFDFPFRANSKWSSSWVLRAQAAVHSNTGGVTDFVSRFTVAYPRSFTVNNFTLPSSLFFTSPLAQLHTVLDYKLQGKALGKPFPFPPVDSPRVIRLKPHIFHYKGHFPTKEKNPQFFEVSSLSLNSLSKY